MNFLAHFYLSGGEDHLIVGNFLADFLKNKEVAQLPRPVREGVRLHRKIDSYTDKHPAVHRSTRHLRDVHGKYAPVILDVLHDFILVKNWEQYATVPLAEFTAGVYAVLKKHSHLMPGFLQERLPRMVADDWLVRYGTEDGLRFTFDRMKTRSSFPHFFENSVESLNRHYKSLEANFNVFFPEAIEAVQGWDLQGDQKTD